MRVSYNWLKEYVDIDLGPDELARDMTMLGLEIEAIERPGADISGVVVGQILSIEPHPDADKLVVCKTDVGGTEPLQIICGAKNMKAGDKVPTAVLGARLAGGFEIARRKMRGIESFGMMCAADELGLGADHSGLLIFDPATPIGIDVKPILGLDDAIFEIEVTPNRGDWASMIGVARELAAFYGRTLRLPEVPLSESGPAAETLSSVTNTAPELCPRYLGRILTGIAIAPSPDWMCKCLIAGGMRPINNVVDVTNYVLLETGHPLHAFDLDKLGEKRIVVRHAQPGEPMTTLDGNARTLTDQMLVIADAAVPQAVAGIMGGGDSEVGETTVNVFLESAYFNPISIRRTSRALGLASESSQRFQRGADPDMAVYAVNRAAQLMQQLAGAAVAPGIIESYPTPVTLREVTLRYARADALLGAAIPPEQQDRHLTGLGFKTIAKTDTSVTYSVPSWRHDVSLEADLIEEVARFQGFHNIPATLPHVRPVETRLAPEFLRIRALRRHIVGLGLTEIYNWTFSNADEIRAAGLPEQYAELVALQNPLSEKQAGMRTSLIPALLQALQYNVNRGTTDLALFEIGPVYRNTAPDALPEQRQTLALALLGNANPQSWANQPRPCDFFDIKGLAENILEHLGVTPQFAPLEQATYQKGQAATILAGATAFGTLGKVSSAVAARFDVQGPALLLEIDLDTALAAAPKPAQFTAIPSYPPSLRDMALVVDSAIPAGALCEAATKAGGKLLISVDIFDIYTGKQVPPGKKSVALSLVFQSPERTLTDKDTQKSWDNIYKQMQKDFRAALR